jgi:uncharacterized Fe-S cluster-containing radical SAM superfamily enzyme
MFKIIFWPFKKFLAWLASGLPSEKKETVEPMVLKPEPIRCYTHKRYKKSCPTCVAAAGNS